MTQQCMHLDQIAITQTDTHVCEECIKIGDRWVHLRIGGMAIADPRHVAELTRIERAPNGVEEVGAMLARLLSAHETIITAVRAAIEQTAQNGDGGSNDLLMGEVLRTHEQQVWGVAEHLVDTPLLRA